MDFAGTAVQSLPDSAAEYRKALPPSAALRGSEARLQALLSSLDDLVFELDSDGIYLGVWTTKDELLAAPRSELLGRGVREVLGEELGLQMVGAVRRALDTAAPEIFEFSL